MRFDRFVAVDWSGASRPVQGENSIWIADYGGGAESVWNPPTRAEAAASLERVIANRGGRVLIGVDFSLGFAAGFAAALGASEWIDVWRKIDALVRDGPSNENNRFEAAAELNRLATGGPAPFWGCPASRESGHLRARRQPHGLPEYRLTETRVSGTHSTWKLYTAGSVGGQTLTGIPRLLRLRERFAGVAIWPFEDPSGADVVIAEVYPSMWSRGDGGRIRDRSQVMAAAGALSSGGPEQMGAWLRAGREEPAAREEGSIFQSKDEPEGGWASRRLGRAPFSVRSR